jgi:protein-arginine kinase activator protein McsA
MTVVLRVRCPYCGFEQKTTSIKTVRCHRCYRTYSVFNPNKRWTKASNVVGIEKGTLQELWQLYNEVYKRKKV